MLLCLAGTTGDVVPGLSLGAALRRAGFPVSVATHIDYKEVVRKLGLDYAFLPYTQKDVFASRAGELLRKRVCRGPAHALGLIKLLRDVQLPLFRAMADLNVTGSSVVLYTPLCAPLQYFAERAGTPAIALHYQTPFPNGAHASPYLSVPSSRYAWANRTTFGLVARAADCFVVPAVREAGRVHDLELPATRTILDEAWRRATLHIQATSPWLTAEVPISPFMERRIGFLPPCLPNYGEPPSALLRKRRLGRRIIFFGVGSAPVGPTLPRFLAALARYAVHADATLVVDQSVGNVSHLPCDVLRVSRVRHDALFPYVNAALITGGAGTVSAALRCGVPLVILPHWFDHFIWRRLLQDRNLAAHDTPPIGRWSGAVSNGLDWALSGIARSNMNEAAARLSEERATEEGVELVVRVEEDSKR